MSWTRQGRQRGGHDEGVAIECWINEGGGLAPEAVLERERRAGAHCWAPRARPRVVIAGGGVAGVETLLALRALAGDRVDITLVTPELRFVNRSMAVEQPFRTQRRRGIRMQCVAAEHDAGWHRGALDRVEHRRRVVVTEDGDELPYDSLVLAIGARADHEWHADGILTFHDGRDYRLLLHQLREGRVNRLAFVKPTGATWPLPLYDLALMTAADCVAHHRPEVMLSLITPEVVRAGDGVDTGGGVGWRILSAYVGTGAGGGGTRDRSRLVTVSWPDPVSCHGQRRGCGVPGFAWWFPMRSRTSRR
jgi:NADPH-dependent 2,4-dienoyl-CoA reductase/sulfur reductase-like enzyme